MNTERHELSDALISGTIAGVATGLAATALGVTERASPAQPLTATSHIVFGDEAARHREASLGYTGTGFLLNHAATIMWAAVYEELFGKDADSRHVGKARAGGAAVAGLANLTDYWLIPERFTPGYEKPSSGGALALSLPLRGLLASGRR